MILAAGYSASFAQSKAPAWIKVGLKFGGSAVSSARVTSESGFDITAKGNYTGKIAFVNKKAIGLAAVNSYYVVTKEFGSDYKAASDYCGAREDSVLYKGGAFYSVVENLYSEDAMREALERKKSEGASAYYISPDNEKIRVEDSSGKTIFIFSGEGGESLALSSSAGYLSYDGKKYRDYLEFKREGSGMTVISTVTTEHYLYSVVPSEIGGSAPLEAQKAQAICARTYAAKNINKHKKNGFNICGTTCCQTYSGMTNENTTSCRAVDETAGKVITYNGEVITAVYSSWSGGQTADAENVWGEKIPYLLPVADPYGAGDKWEYALDYNKITALMASKGYNIGQVTGIKVTESGNDGRVTVLTIVGENGEKKFLKESARTALGLKSQLYYIE